MKNKIYKRIFIIIVICSLLAMYGSVPIFKNVNASNSIYDARDLLSSSGVNVLTTHTFTFTTASTTPNGGDWRITFPTGFSGLATSSVTCAYGAANFTEDAYDQYVFCRRTGSDQIATSTQVVVTSVINPATSTSYQILIENREADGTVRDYVNVMVAITEGVHMTATVDSVLDFTITGLADTETVNLIGCDVNSSATSTPFGTLTLATTTACQRLNVTTNAQDGYIVTVEQNQELTSDSGATINSFNNSQDGTGSTTAQGWEDPRGVMDMYNTYGHMGLTSSDSDLNSLGGYNSFAPGDTNAKTQFAGLNDQDPMVVMHHTGPTTGTVATKGQADIAYSLKITALQEAGDYESILTYICTPTY